MKSTSVAGPTDQTRRRGLTPFRAVRLDGVRNPFGPCSSALEAMGQAPQASASALTRQLCQRLSELYRVPSGAMRLFNDSVSALQALTQNTDGTFVTFAPSAAAILVAELWSKKSHETLIRGVGTGEALPLDLAADLPCQGAAIVDSPSDPLGSLLAPADAVRIARSCRCLVVDERFAEFAGRTLLPLVFEFDNVAVVRSFSLWAGFENASIAWAVITPQSLLDVEPPELSVDPHVIAAAIATLDDLQSVEATLRILRGERSRLFRLLRKISFLDPLPSWGPFLSARVAIGDRRAVATGLQERGIHIHAPEQCGLESYVRFGIGLPSEMERLKAALLDLAPEIVG